MQDNETTEESQDESTGHKLELSEASTKLAEAVVSGDPVALRLAADAHATALNSQATAMAASIAAPLYKELQALRTSIDTKAREDRQAALAQQNISRTWLDDESERRKTQIENFIAELNALPAAMQEVMAVELGKILPRIEDIEAGMADLKGVVSNQGEQINSIEARLLLVEETPGTSPSLLKSMTRIEKIVEAYESRFNRLLAGFALIIFLFLFLLLLNYIRG